MSLDVSGFAAAFEAVHGCKPYEWQSRLLREVATKGEWPAVIAAPTGAGKTAVLDVALFHLAMQADAHPRTAPMRIVFAVDRRIIVDQAFERAQEIRNALDTEPGLAAVRQALSRLSGDKPLHVEQLRGGVPREDDWARSPHQPTILCTTVDQLGSRLLFRGYGVSDAMAPIHAGLLGQDALLILDEAHLSRAFASTLASVKKRQSGAERSLSLPFAFTQLTATPRDDTDVFRLEPVERAEPAIRKRLAARKLARLPDPRAKGAGRTVAGSDEAAAPEDEDTDEVAAKPAGVKAAAARFVEAAKALRTELGGAPVIAAVVNRVVLARAVHGGLDEEPGAKAILLTGRVRQAERDALIESDLPRLKGHRLSPPPEEALFVVATQCIEAGADFDFDGLVTQIAPLDALAQRFGRLARSGERGGPAPATIVALPEDIAKRADDPIYGDRMRLTWEWLGRQGRTADGAIDLGPDALAALIAADPEGADACRAGARDAPLLRAADIDFLAMTNPAPHPDPLLPLFLHGDPRIETDVAIVWRADLAAADLAESHRAADIVSAMPPRPGEAVSVPIAAARRWLRRGRAPALADIPTPDVESAEGGGTDPRKALRWRRKDPEVVGAGQIRPGDTLVVPATYGGCDRFGWNPDGRTPDGEIKPVDDIADLAAKNHRERGDSFSLRLHPQVRPEGARVPSWEKVAAALSGASESRSGASSLIRAVIEAYDQADERDDTESHDETVEPRESPIAARARVDALTALRAIMRLNHGERPRLRVEWPYGDVGDAPVGAVIVVGKAPVASDDADAATFLERRKSLKAHIELVEKMSDRSAAILRLPAFASDALRRSAALHDDGKADERFQAFLAAKPGELLGKSGLKRSRREDALARERAGLPGTWRHEALSVRLAAASFAANPPPGDVDLDLALWLIGTHHGQGRPFFRHDDPWDDEARECGAVALPAGAGPHRLDFDWAGEDWAGLFDALRRRYGAWGLAYLEAVLRLADHRASEAGDRPDREGADGAQP